MAAKDVRKIRTRYKAVQWTEQKKDASDIVDLFDEFGVEGYTYFTDDMKYAEINISNSKTGSEYHLLKHGQWVVASSKGKVEVLFDDQYTEKYEYD